MNHFNRRDDGRSVVQPGDASEGDGDERDARGPAARAPAAEDGPKGRSDAAGGGADEDDDDEEGDEGEDDTERADDESDPDAGGRVGDGEVPPVSRKVRRRRRRRRSRPRSRTIAMKRLTREELRLGALLYPPVDLPRPSSRLECAQEVRPCPWVACKHHLYLDVNPETGSIKINFPDLEPWELSNTCALDVADRGGITLEEVGEIMNLTRERIRQVEVRGLLKLKMASPSPEELGAGLLNPDPDDLD